MKKKYADHLDRIHWYFNTKIKNIRTPGIEPGTIRYLLHLQSNALPTELCSVTSYQRRHLTLYCKTQLPRKTRNKRQRRDSNPRGQSPSDFESDSLTTRTHCLLTMASSLLRSTLREFQKKLTKYKFKTTPVGFEPTRAEPTGLAGRRLNHSAKVSF